MDFYKVSLYTQSRHKAGTGYQTMMNEALRQYLSNAEQPITETILRNVLREEIPEYLTRAAPRRSTEKVMKSTAKARRTAKRDLFAELSEGASALAEERVGKRTLRTHSVESKPAPQVTGSRRPRSR
jgi:hypothetical protein